jgi:hypothetical protein
MLTVFWAMEKAENRKSPKAGLSRFSWKSRNPGGIPTFPTAPATAMTRIQENQNKKPYG